LINLVNEVGIFRWLNYWVSAALMFKSHVPAWIWNTACRSCRQNQSISTNKK